jgi:hypothetical protein
LWQHDGDFGGASMADQLATKTVLLVVPSGRQASKFYAPPPFIITWHSFRMERRLAVRPPASVCRSETPDVPLTEGEVWIQWMAGRFRARDEHHRDRARCDASG